MLLFELVHQKVYNTSFSSWLVNGGTITLGELLEVVNTKMCMFSWVSKIYQENIPF